MTAAIVVSTTIDSLSKPLRLTTLGRKIVDRLIMEVRVRAWSYQYPQLWKYWLRRWAEKGTTHYEHRKRTMNTIMRITT